MGILDEAIREHLELKRQHGAEETELEGLESEAFGPADRPDATEANTEVISPGSSVTVPAGEGDQLDKVFEATRQQAANQATGEAATGEEATATEHAIPGAEATSETAAQPEERFQAEDDGEPNWSDDKTPQGKTEQPTVESPVEPEPEPAKSEPDEASSGAYDDGGDSGDAGDALQRERQHLSDHPTEHYDVDAAIAEEEEIDILSESSLSDELDRALDGPLTGMPAPEPEAQTPAEPEPAAPAESAVPEDAATDEPVTDEPVNDEFETAFDDEHDGEPEEPESVGAAEEPVEGDPDFFDQDDPLEATPDFLEETPEHDRLWFEQKPPKDFEFGD